jgi:hypothetical protein
MENFFSLLQKNAQTAKSWDTGDSAASRSSPGSNAATTAADTTPRSAA